MGRELAAYTRVGAPWYRHWLLLVVLALLAVALARVVGDTEAWLHHRLEVLVTLGGLACWRWSWFLIQNTRALSYRVWTFPRLRRQAEQAVARFGPVPELTILATTFHEKPWITEAVFTSLVRELSRVQGLQRRPKVVVVTGCDADDRKITEVFHATCAICAPEATHPGEERALWPPELVLLRGDQGKRPALAAGMEEIARGQPHPDGAVVFMDADTFLQPGCLEKTLPLFRLTPPVAAVTTNETGRVQGPYWFAEWVSLRFGLRHRTMCSVALSGRLLCLTGRFSVFRASVVCNPSFRAQVACDRLEHWLWGEFEMLSGDDKSTWYWLSAHGQRMLYVPDAKVTTLEVVQGPALKRALANIRRWSGNSVRHSWRAIKLGPTKLGWFPWYSLLDQRLAMVTVLFGPAVALLALLGGHYEIAAGYALWVMASRVCHAAIAWRQGRRWSAYYIPLQVLSDWAVALTKLWVLFHPAKQAWLNRGARTLDTTRGRAGYTLRTGFAHYLYGFGCLALVAAVGVFVGFLPLGREARLFLSGAFVGSAPSLRCSERDHPAWAGQPRSDERSFAGLFFERAEPVTAEENFWHE